MRRAAHLILTMFATLLMFPALALVGMSVACAVLGARAWPGATWSNCWAWASVRAWDALTEWRRDGMPVGMEPRMQWRWSRSRPRWVPHFLVGFPSEPGSDWLALESFKPDEPSDVPIWRACAHLMFAGRVRRGDSVGD